MTKKYRHKPTVKVLNIPLYVYNKAAHESATFVFNSAQGNYFIENKKVIPEEEFNNRYRLEEILKPNINQFGQPLDTRQVR